MQNKKQRSFCLNYILKDPSLFFLVSGNVFMQSFLKDHSGFVFLLLIAAMFLLLVSLSCTSAILQHNKLYAVNLSSILPPNFPPPTPPAL